MNTIAYKGYEYKVPGTWDELSKSQYLKLCAILLYYYSRKKLTPAEWRVIREECLIVLLNFKRGLFFLSKEVQNFKQMDVPHQVALLNHEEILPWIFEKVNLKVYLIKDFKIGWDTYAGPYSGMMEVTAEEFIEAHIYSQLYEQTKEDKHLVSLMALLYRPIDAHFEKRAAEENVPDMRVRNTVFSQEAREQLFGAKLGATLRTAIYLQYCSHLDHFTQMFPSFFKKSEKKKEEVSDLASYLVLIKNISGGKFGSYNETKRQRADMFFNEVEQKIEEYENIKYNK
jgi:hypothetical protein